MESTESGFGDAFASAREQMGLSQREVAEELKPVSYTHLTLPTNREV